MILFIGLSSVMEVAAKMTANKRLVNGFLLRFHIELVVLA